MDMAKTIDLTCLCIQITNTVFFSIMHQSIHDLIRNIKLIKKSKTKRMSMTSWNCLMSCSVLKNNTYIKMKTSNFTGLKWKFMHSWIYLQQINKTNLFLPVVFPHTHPFFQQMKEESWTIRSLKPVVCSMFTLLVSYTETWVDLGFLFSLSNEFDEAGSQSKIGEAK